MSASVLKLRHSHVNARNEPGRRVQKVKPADKAMLTRLAGEMYDRLPGSNDEVARRLGCGRVRVWRMRSGAHPTRLSRLGEEMLWLQKNGFDTSFVSTFISLIDAARVIDEESLYEVENALKEAHREEQGINARLNDLQWRYKDGELVDRQITQAAMEQARLSARLALLHWKRGMLRAGERRAA